MMTAMTVTSSSAGYYTPPHTIRHFARIAITAILVSLLFACKIVVTVPEGGKVVSEDGFECLAGQTCMIEVSDDTFDSTFTAVPAKGYTFTRWKRKNRSFCGNQNTPCRLKTTNFGEKPKLVDVLASDTNFFLEPMFVSYDLAYWRQTLAEIDQGSFATESFLYAIKPIIGGCDPGSLKQGPKSRGLEALNQTRSLHRLPEADYDAFYDMQVQESSLVQKANNYVNHFPGPGDACYTSGAAEAASTSNLSSRSERSDPASDLFGWTNDNTNLAALMEAGHRRWILFPELGYASYGQVEGFSTLKVFDFGMPPMNPVPPDLEYVALPFKAYPYVLVSQGAKPTPWSLSIVPPSGMSSDFDYFSNASISVVEKDSGKNLVVNSVHTDNKGFGLSNFLSWMVNGWDYDVDYIVTVSGINMQGNNSSVVEYPVVVDRYNLLDINHPREPTDGKQGQTMQGKFNTPDDEDSYGVSLAGNQTFTGQSEFANWAFFVLVYDQNKRLVKSSDKPFSANFSVGKHTVVISHCDENGICYQSTQNYTVSFN